MEQQHANSMWVRAYSADGFEMSLTLAVNSVAEAAAQLEAVRAAGFLPRKPEVVGGEVEQVAVVVRRASKKGTPIIDFYAVWSHEGKFGAYKWGHLYLDTVADVAQFEAQSGLRLGDLPLYEGQTPIQRTFGSPTRFEIDVKRAFAMRRTETGKNDNGMPAYEYRYATPMTVTLPARRIDSVEVAKAFVTEVGKRFGVTDYANILKCLGIAAFGEWQGSYDEAMARVATVVEAIQS